MSISPLAIRLIHLADRRRSIVQNFYSSSNPLLFIVKNVELYTEYFHDVGGRSWLRSNGDPRGGDTELHGELTGKAKHEVSEGEYFTSLCESVIELGCAPRRIISFFLRRIEDGVTLTSIDMTNRHLLALAFLGDDRIDRFLLNEIENRKHKVSLSLQSLTCFLYALTLIILRQKREKFVSLILTSLPHPPTELLQSDEKDFFFEKNKSFFSSASGVGLQNKIEDHAEQVREQRKFIQRASELHVWYTNRYVTHSQSLFALERKDKKICAEDVLHAVWAIGIRTDNTLPQTWVKLLGNQCCEHRSIFRAEHIAHIGRALYPSWKAKENESMFSSSWSSLVSGKHYLRSVHVLSASDLYAVAVVTDSAYRVPNVSRLQKTSLGQVLAKALTRLCELEKGYDLIHVFFLALGDHEYRPKILHRTLQRFIFLINQDTSITISSRSSNSFIQQCFAQKLRTPPPLSSRLDSALDSSLKSTRAFDFLYNIHNYFDPLSNKIFIRYAGLLEQEAVIKKMTDLTSAQKISFLTDTLRHLRLLPKDNPLALQQFFEKQFHALTIEG